jgi:uncharacterized protein (DUF58 family)
MAATDSSGLIVNEYETSLSYPLMVFLNADPSEYPAKNRELHFERVIEAAASLCIMASRERQALGLMLYTGRTETNEVISPSSFALIPILERLATLKRRDIQKEEENWENRGSIIRLLEAGKTLPFGTRVVYTGSSLDIEEWRILEGMKGSHLSLEYLMIDEKSLAPLPRRYQIKESGYEIL